MSSYKTIPFVTEDGETVNFFILEQTMINGINYLLVTDDVEDEDAECMMMKEAVVSDGDFATYEFVEDEEELNAVFRVFAELLEDADIALLYD